MSHTHSHKHVRLGRLAEVDRIAFVATAGFYYSTVNKFVRAYRDVYPEDTLADYKDRFHNAILDPDKILIVVEDIYRDNEDEAVYDALKRVHPDGPPDLGEDNMVIVGVLIIVLQEDSHVRGQFQPEGSSYDDC